MTDLKLDANHDLAWNGTDLALVGATSETDDLVDEIAQRLLIAFKTYLGEYFLDTEAGFPYLTEAFVKNPDMEALAARMRSVAGAVEGVESVLSIESLLVDRTTRELTGRVEINTIYRPTTVTVDS